MSEVLAYIPVPDDVEVPEGMTASWVFIPTHEVIASITPTPVTPAYVRLARPSLFDESRLNNAFALYKETAAANRLFHRSPTFLRWHERIAVRFVNYVDKFQSRHRVMLARLGVL